MGCSKGGLHVAGAVLPLRSNAPCEWVVDPGDDMKLPGGVVDGAPGAHDPALPDMRVAEFG